jgi:hypothetical protein
VWAGEPTASWLCVHNADPSSSKAFVANRITAHKHTTRLHVLRDRVKRALRDLKHGRAGAAERVATHKAARAAYRTAHP